jgi:hypothetical protein
MLSRLEESLSLLQAAQRRASGAEAEDATVGDDPAPQPEQLVAGKESNVTLEQIEK